MASKSDEQTLQRLRLYARELLERGKSEQEVIRTLVDSGISSDDARAIVGNTRFHDDSAFMSRVYELARKTALANVVVEGLVCAAGTVITLVSYNSAAVLGDRYVFAWGAILFGGVQLIAGIGGLLSTGFRR